MDSTATLPNLDFSAAYAFDRTPLIAPAKVIDVPIEFYTQGYAVVDDITSPEAAEQYLEQFIASLDQEELPLFARFAGRVQQASKACIPTCHAIIDTTFQGLHFDMGLPLHSPSPQAVQLLLALYRPRDGRESTAATRVVPLRPLLKQGRWPAANTLHHRLMDYASRHGDGWVAPERVNTYRLACLARLIDAAAGTSELTRHRDVATGLEFRDPDNDESRSLQNEAAFFERYDMKVSGIEEQMRLAQGQLLIVDNIRTAHGRIGKRQPQELWHYLYGVASATPDDITVVRNEVVAQFD